MNTQEIEKQVKHLAAFEDKLVPGAVKVAMKDSNAKSSDLWRVPLSEIKVREGYNPRLETDGYREGLTALAASMIENGFYDSKPIAVSVASENGKNVLYVEDGHRRRAAALIAVEKGAPIETVPVVVMPRSTSEVERLVHMVHSNNDGEKFTPLELGIIVQRMEKFGLNEGEIAAKLSMTTTYVRHLQTLMSAPATIREAVKAGEISATLAIETVQEHKDAAEEVFKEAREEAKKTGKRVTGKTVKAAAAKRKKPTKAELAEKALKQQKKHGPEAFDLLQRIFKKHGKVIAESFHREVEPLFITCGVVEE
jgi:ParB-like chromosome segregation protein Spo0J